MTDKKDRMRVKVFHLPQETAKRLRQEAFDQETTEVAVVRGALDEYFKKLDFQREEARRRAEQDVF